MNNDVEITIKTNDREKVYKGVYAVIGMVSESEDSDQPRVYRGTRGSHCPDTGGHCPESRPGMSGIDCEALLELADILGSTRETDCRGCRLEGTGCAECSSGVAHEAARRIREALGVEHV